MHIPLTWYSFCFVGFLIFKFGKNVSHFKSLLQIKLTNMTLNFLISIKIMKFKVCFCPLHFFQAFHHTFHVNLCRNRIHLKIPIWNKLSNFSRLGNSHYMYKIYTFDNETSPWTQQVDTDSAIIHAYYTCIVTRKVCIKCRHVCVSISSNGYI